MRKFRVEVEETLFELEVEEYKQVPLITNTGEHNAWRDSGRREAMQIEM